MAQRPVYISQETSLPFVVVRLVDFDWYPGFSISQKQKSIESLHNSVRDFLDINSVLEISSKSLTPLGVSLSAFNLKICTVKKGRVFSVESAFQASKVFQFGGPYLDLLDKTSREAKTDPRLKSSGKLIKFKFFGSEWQLEPKTAFYDWLYTNTLRKHEELAEAVTQFSAFTDIEFNPSKSINCQAYSAALFVSLKKRGLLEKALSSKEDFLSIVEYGKQFYQTAA